MPRDINSAINGGILSQKDIDNSLKYYQVMIDGEEKILLASEDRVDKIMKKLISGRNDLSIKQRREYEQKAYEIAARYQENLYKSASAYQKKEMLQKQKDSAELYKEQLRQEKAMKQAIIDNSKASAKERKDAQRHLDEIAKKQAKMEEEERKAKEKIKKIEDIEMKNLSFRDKFLKKQEDSEKKIAELKQKIIDSQIKQAEAQDEQTKKEEEAREKQLRAEEKTEEKNEKKAKWMQSLSKAASNAVNNAIGGSISAVDNAMTDVLSYQSMISTRLGLNRAGYKDLTKTISQNTALSPYITQQNTMANLSKMVESGIAYNVELRAFLATVSDKIATTFDAFDSNLLRIVRIQQADTTASRLGMEASITSLLNKNYLDSSYMSDMYKDVSGALLDASAMMTRDQSTEFEYTVQKWLGSLYSLGMSNSAISSIATGINYLGTGNVDALMSSGVGNLFAMASARGGLSYGDILSNGLNAQTTNILLQNMVEYLRDIADGTNSMVAKTALGNVFGVGISDLRSIKNLTSSDINGIFGAGMSYDSSIKYLNNALGSIGQRMNAGEMISNMVGNLMYSTGANIATNPLTYATWLLTKEMKNLTGGTNIPTIGAVGNFIDMNATVEDLMQLALIGGGIIGSLGQALSGGNLSGTNLSSWNFADYTTRGTNFSGVLEGIREGVSLSTTIVSSGSDIQQQTLDKATESAKKEGAVAEDKDFGDLYDALFGGDSTDRKPILVEISGMSPGASSISVVVENGAEKPISVVEAY